MTSKEAYLLLTEYKERIKNNDKLKSAINFFNRKITLKQSITPLTIETHQYGITYIKFYGHKLDNNIIYLSITIDCMALIMNTITNNLFVPNYDSIMALCLAYAAAMSSIFPIINNDCEETPNLCKLPYLTYGKVIRIDYSLNLYTDNKELTLILLGKSYTDSRKTAKKFNNNNLFALSSAKRPSSITKIYDKELYYNDNQNCFDEKIIEASKNILRYEYQRNIIDKDWLKSNYNLSERFLSSIYVYSPIAFFNCSSIRNILLKEYERCIGLGDWKNDYYYKDTIEKSTLSKHYKNVMLKNFAPLFSKKRSKQKALDEYIKNGGTQNTFDKYMSLYESLRLNPLRIPDRKAAFFKTNKVNNPINNIMVQSINYNNFIIQYKVDSTLKAKIIADLDSVLELLGA